MKSEKDDVLLKKESSFENLMDLHKESFQGYQVMENPKIAEKYKEKTKNFSSFRSGDIEIFMEYSFDKSLYYLLKEYFLKKL